MTLSRKTTVKLVATAVLAVAVSVLVARVGFRPRATDVTPDSVAKTPRPAIVRLDAALRAHPRWGELELLTSEVGEEVARWDSYRGAVSSAAQDGSDVAGRVNATADAQLKALEREAQQRFEAIRGSYQRRLEDREREVWAEAQAKLEARKAAIAADLDQTVGVRRGQLKTELAEKVAEIKQEYQSRILSNQLRLGSLSGGDGSSAEAERLRAELGEQQSAMDREAATAEKEFAGRFDTYVKDETAKAEAQLKAYRDTVTAEAERTLQAERERLQASMQAEAASAKASLEQALARAMRPSSSDKPSPSGRARALQVRRNDLQDRMLSDIRKAAETIAKRRGLAGVDLDNQIPSTGVDVTEDVVRLLAQGG